MTENSSEKLDSSTKITVSGKYSFRVGEMFHSYEELEKRLELHCSESFVYYWRRDTRECLIHLSLHFREKLNQFLRLFRYSKRSAHKDIPSHCK